MMIRIKKKNIIMLIELLAIAEPAYISYQYAYMNALWHMLVLTCMTYLLVEIINKNLELRKTINILIPVMIFITITASTFLNAGEISQSVFRMIYYSYSVTLSAVNLMDVENREDFVRLSRNILLLLILINYITIVRYPEGMYATLKLSGGYEYRHWFLGFKNGIGKYCIMLIALCFFCQVLRQTFLNTGITVLAIVISALSVAKIQSGSGMIGIFITVVLVFFVNINATRYLKIFRMRNLALVVLFMFFSIVISGQMFNNAAFSYIVEKVLGRSGTLRSRIYIWANVLKIIRKNFLIGVGVRSGNEFVRLIGVGYSASDAHNFYLEFFMEGGLICFIFLIIFLFRIIRILDANRNNRLAQALSAGLFALMIVFITENCNNYFLWLFLGICMNYSMQRNDSKKTVVSEEKSEGGSFHAAEPEEELFIQDLL